MRRKAPSHPGPVTFPIAVLFSDGLAPDTGVAATGKGEMARKPVEPSTSVTELARTRGFGDRVRSFTPRRAKPDRAGGVGCLLVIVLAPVGVVLAVPFAPWTPGMHVAGYVLTFVALVLPTVVSSRDNRARVLHGDLHVYRGGLVMRSAAAPDAGF